MLNLNIFLVLKCEMIKQFKYFITILQLKHLVL